MLVKRKVSISVEGYLTIFYHKFSGKELILTLYRNAMVKNLIVVGILSVGLFSCESVQEPAGDDQKSELNEISKKKTSIDSDEPEAIIVDANRVMTMELEGMVCSMGCGGSIRKELNAKRGVAICEFDFEDERAIDIATIKFDKNQITVDEIIAIVSKMNDSQFKVIKTSVERLEPVNVKEVNTSSKKSSKPRFEAANASFHFPNIFDLFSAFFS